MKIGAKVVSHARYVTFQMAEIAVRRELFREILRLIAQLGAPSAVPGILNLFSGKPDRPSQASDGRGQYWML